MKTKERSAELQAQLDALAALAALGDTDVDTIDIPEAALENWMQAKRPRLYRPIKKPVTLRLDADVIEWFKDHTDGSGYQTEINRVLRRHVAGTETAR
jgi:uncharacterized protein (DUF4415 family)